MRPVRPIAPRYGQASQLEGFLPDMSIRFIAIELYRIMKEVEALERQIQELPPNGLGAGQELHERLRRARAEQARIRKMLEGAKSD
jgi:hypothetical protein